jgi:hypothetical protein
MKSAPLVALGLVLAGGFLDTHATAAEGVAPGLADTTLEETATRQLVALVSGLDEPTQAALRGIYVAIDPSRTEVAALPACDDDGDYVIVLSRALLDLVRQVAAADATDRLSGTDILDGYATLLARAQRRDARPLPPPAPRRPAQVVGSRSGGASDLARGFTEDALAWLVADELARAVAGDVVCPRPTVTREAGDGEWTPTERAEALARAPSRMGAATERPADVWATHAVLARHGSEGPAVTLLRVMARLEEARPPGGASVYLTLHPGSRERAEVVEVAAWTWRDDRAGAQRALESSAGAAGMR